MIQAKVVRESDKYVEHDLQVGETYDVENISMGGFHTTVWLVGKKEGYNSVIFDFYENGKELDIYEDPRFNPYI